MQNNPRTECFPFSTPNLNLPVKIVKAKTTCRWGLFPRMTEYPHLRYSATTYSHIYVKGIPFSFNNFQKLAELLCKYEK